LELDIKVWKELAIEKQMLMSAVTEALGLDDKASEEEIRNGILAGVEKIAKTESIIAAMRAEHEAAATALEEKLASECDKRSQFEQEVARLSEDLAALESKLEAVRVANQTETQNLKTQLETKNRELKNINNVLGDSPANTAKRMKSLNKKKHDETEARKRAESELKNVQKEVRSLKQEVESQKAKIEALEADSESDSESTSEKKDGDKESIAA
jgi:septal ring factor EnvC (AmiA/AmiB activator)